MESHGEHDVLEHNVSTLLETGGERPQIAWTARARIRAKLVARYGTHGASYSFRGGWLWVGLLAVAMTIGICTHESRQWPDVEASAVEACLAAAQASAPLTTALCERASRETRDENIAVAGALYALRAGDDAALGRWAARARPTLDGARILHFLGERQQSQGDFAGAEASLRRALDLQVDRDPVRAANTALLLLARLAWEQAERGQNEMMRAYAATSLIEVLVDLGEFATAQAVIDRMDVASSPTWRDMREVAIGRVDVAQGRVATGIARFRRASRLDPRDQVDRSQLPSDAIDLAEMLLEHGQVAEARREVDRACELVRRRVLNSPEIQCRLAAAEAQVLLAEGDTDAALETVARGLEIRSRDAARVRLLNVQGDALARGGDLAAAEQAWRRAADSVEIWRDSIPTTQLRSGLVARHRHALEAWLDAAGQRGDVESAFEVTRRVIGRELLDRIRQRESGAPSTADASIRDVESRLAARRELSVTMAGSQRRGDLRDVRQDMTAIMVGARSVWAIHHARGRWSIARVGGRDTVRRWVDGYRKDIDDPVVAAALGEALFPEDALPAPGTPLVVMLDPELSDLALAGLRVGGRYLVERTAILEVLAPDLLFTPVPDHPWGTVVAIGDPLRDLPSATNEIRDVAKQTGTTEYLAAGAVRAVLAASGEARVLHIATHSRIEDGRAAFVLSDGVLSANEIVNLKLAPRLAVIATCRSQVDDDPTSSLAAAFLAAGAPAVIGSKRTLDDRDGATLMREFYHLHGATDPLRALALAQRAAIAANRPPHAWAAVSFFGVGGWVGS